MTSIDLQSIIIKDKCKYIRQGFSSRLREFNIKRISWNCIENMKNDKSQGCDCFTVEFWKSIMKGYWRVYYSICQLCVFQGRIIYYIETRNCINTTKRWKTQENLKNGDLLRSSMLQKIASGWIAINILKTVLDYFILENQKSEVMKEKTRLKKIKSL